ncbi:MAG: nucleoside-diphosphate kinase [Candidatus Gracilibacteria bacterium]|nr:nucleoside-diphosphate kinase [Candidatus Gracilibacteria bacterium]
MQKTLIILKPDAVQRGLIGEVTRRFERKGLKLIGMKMMNLEEAMLADHYSHIADKPFFPGIVKFMKSSPVIVQSWEGKEAVEAVRTICGITNARKADAGTIRGDFAMSMQCNVVHASDSEENGKAEVARFFKEEELFSYDKGEYIHVYADDEIA